MNENEKYICEKYASGILIGANTDSDFDNTEEATCK